MKKFYTACLAFQALSTGILAQDLPSPAAQMVTLPRGSYVIAMDNINQHNAVAYSKSPKLTITAGSTAGSVDVASDIFAGMSVSGNGIQPGTTIQSVNYVSKAITLSNPASANISNATRTFSSPGVFNMKTYGLLVTLLNNRIKMKWVINSLKSKDGIDFSVSASQVRPAAGSAADLSFRSGPFVIFPQDTAGVAALVQSFNASKATNVKLYLTHADVAVDIRYDMNGFIPKGAVLNDGRNSAIHTGYMTTAAIPTTNYSFESSGNNLVVNCYTFASEPHNTSSSPALIANIRNFVLNGGNFLAQCEAVRTYENSSNGRFQTTGGIGYEKGAGTNSNATFNTSASFPNPNLSYSQFDGPYNMNEGGSLQNWRLAPGSSYAHGTHHHVEGGSSAAVASASVSKLAAPGERGGLVFYLGSHEFDLSDISNINGMRMYMNAFLTPTPNSGVIKYNGAIDCGGPATGRSVSMFAQQAPSGAFPISFELFADMNGDNQINAGDESLGTATATSNNTPVSVSITNLAYANQPYYIARATTNAGCYANTYSFLITNICGALPVRLLSFNAKLQRDKVYLSWETSMEFNNKGFHVERRKGNGQYETIGFIASKAPGGTGNGYSYGLVDMDKLADGVTYYRLRQEDIDGKTSYSDIRAIRTNSRELYMTVYPNPSNGKTQLAFPEGTGQVDVTLQDFSGKTLRRWTMVNRNLQISDLRPGIYLLVVHSRENGEQLIEKLLVR